ncbi:LysR substrate-binding domain-containing protein [Pseudomonas indica]|uniref:LysR substrate-binding domain-containing protein n=1 Tax=Pseudomonas indica TaxID=137658 RepID=UPI003F636FE2
MMSERLQGIDAFVQAVEAGSFAQAAERMRLTRSAVGKSIARLERRLGVRLFHRTTRRQSLTEDGQAYYERCKRALAELEDAEAALDNGRREPSGRLRVSVPVLFGRHCVAPVLTRLARQYPRLEVEIAFSDRVVDLLEEGFDLAVRVGDLRDSSTLAARRLGTQHLAICAAPSYLDAHGWPRTIEELSGHVGIHYSQTGQESPWQVLDEEGRLHEPHIRSKLRFDDLQAIADAAVAGAGLARLPCWLLTPHVRSGELALVVTNERVLPTEIHAVWPQTRYLPSKIRVAIDALVEEIPARIAPQECRPT